MESTTFIAVSGLTKTYNFGRTRALDGITLEIKAGETFGLIGPNGAGKTTLMGCLLGLLRPSRGIISINGLSPHDLSIKRVTGFMPERPTFDKWMNVTQFLTYQYMLSGRSLKEKAITISDALETVKLERTAWKRPIRKLSRGMLQRVGLAQILIAKPQLCFLDEPTSGMDPMGMALVRDLLLKWKADGATVVLNSHHLHEVERVCDRVAFIQAGKIQAIESVNESINGMIFSVRWETLPNVQDETAVLSELVAELGVILKEAQAGSAKIIISEAKQSVEIIKFLVTRGVPVLEAGLERKPLLDLFVQSELTK
jgi:ABC-2 type transport system ATP-binding protein